jgi:hypothetical protein
LNQLQQVSCHRLIRNCSVQGGCGNGQAGIQGAAAEKASSRRNWGAVPDPGAGEVGWQARLLAHRKKSTASTREKVRDSIGLQKVNANAILSIFALGLGAGVNAVGQCAMRLQEGIAGQRPVALTELKLGAWVS